MAEEDTGIVDNLVRLQDLGADFNPSAVLSTPAAAAKPTKGRGRQQASEVSPDVLDALDHFKQAGLISDSKRQPAQKAPRGRKTKAQQSAEEQEQIELTTAASNALKATAPASPFAKPTNEQASSKAPRKVSTKAQQNKIEKESKEREELLPLQLLINRYQNSKSFKRHLEENGMIVKSDKLVLMNKKQLNDHLTRIRACVANKSDLQLVTRGYFYVMEQVEAFNQEPKQAKIREKIDLKGLHQTLRASSGVSEALDQLEIEYGFASNLSPQYRLLLHTAQTAMVLNALNQDIKIKRSQPFSDTPFQKPSPLERQQTGKAGATGQGPPIVFTLPMPMPLERQQTGQASAAEQRQQTGAAEQRQQTDKAEPDKPSGAEQPYLISPAKSIHDLPPPPKQLMSMSVGPKKA